MTPDALLLLQSALGILALLVIAWALSENRRAVRLRPIVAGVVLQLLIAALALKLPLIKAGFMALFSSHPPIEARIAALESRP